MIKIISTNSLLLRLEVLFDPYSYTCTAQSQVTESETQWPIDDYIIIVPEVF